MAGGSSEAWIRRYESLEVFLRWPQLRYDDKEARGSSEAWYRGASPDEPPGLASLMLQKSEEDHGRYFSGGGNEEGLRPMSRRV